VVRLLRIQRVIVSRARRRERVVAVLRRMRAGRGMSGEV
jgi:hypothetical protein